MQLPEELQGAIRDVLGSLPPKRLATIAAELSGRYRSEREPSGSRLVRSREDALAYAAFRLPATYAAAEAALRQVDARLPDFRPTTLLDAGAGPGSAAWAATQIWPSIGNCTLLERDPDMAALGRRLQGEAASPALRRAAWRNQDLTQGVSDEPRDLVMAAYVLGELRAADRDALVAQLWAATNGVLLLVEPGTPQGFERIRHARDLLRAVGARTVAPCPHDGRCPIAGLDWCHFSQRVARSALHREVKGGALGHEDEKFSYVAVARVAARASRARVIRHPQVHGGHIALELCAPDGLRRRIVARSDRERFRQARAIEWGAEVPWEDG